MDIIEAYRLGKISFLKGEDRILPWKPDWEPKIMKAWTIGWDHGKLDNGTFDSEIQKMKLLLPILNKSVDTEGYIKTLEKLNL